MAKNRRTTFFPIFPPYETVAYPGQNVKGERLYFAGTLVPVALDAA
jgi:hypothetical protein